MALAAPKVQSSMFKVQSYEKGNLEIHHSDRCGHLDRHRHQPGSHQLHLLKEATPGPSKEEGNHEEDEQSSSFFFFNFFLISLEFSETTDDLLRLLFGTIILIRLIAHRYQAYMFILTQRRRGRRVHTENYIFSRR